MNLEYACNKCRHNLIFTDRAIEENTPCDVPGCAGHFVLRYRGGWVGPNDTGKFVCERFDINGERDEQRNDDGNSKDPSS